VFLGSPASSQYVPVIQACSRDVVAYCGPDRMDGSRLAECIKVHFQEFTEPCKAALVKTTAVFKACGLDLQQQCTRVKAGAGRILLCVKQHFAAMSEPCKNAIGHAAERKGRGIDHRSAGRLDEH
jgi:hypothetical protein